MTFSKIVRKFKKDLRSRADDLNKIKDYIIDNEGHENGENNPEYKQCEEELSRIESFLRKIKD